jgi:hypothetical protein
MQEQQPSYELGTPGESSTEFLFGVFNAVATVCFAWGGHNVALVSLRCLLHDAMCRQWLLLLLHDAVYSPPLTLHICIIL